MYNRETQMLIYMINTYTDAVYGTTGNYDTIKADIMSATGMDEGFFESIKDELDFISFAKDEEFVYEAPVPVTPTMSSPRSPMLNTYDEAVAHLCAALNQRDDEMDPEDVRTPIKIEDFIPLFSSTNYFGIYCYHGDRYYDGQNEYYLVDKASGGHAMVLGDSFEFVGTNLLSCMEGEKVLDIHNNEFVQYLIDGCLDNAKNIFPIEELAGIAVLQSAQREDRKKQGLVYPHPSLADSIKAASAVKKAEQKSSVPYKCWTIFENNGQYTVGGRTNYEFLDCTLENLIPSPNEKSMVDWCREHSAASITFVDLPQVGSESEVSYEKYLAHLAKYDSEQADDLLSEEFIVPVVRFSSVEGAKEFLDWVDKEMQASASLNGNSRAASLSDQIQDAADRAAEPSLSEQAQELTR